MKIIFAVFPLSAALITGCATNSVPTMPVEQGAVLISEFQSTPLSDDKIRSKITEWVQPENKNEMCKIRFLDDDQDGDGIPFWEDEAVSIYWDGACKGGYAHGLGREFYESPQTGLSASLSSYGEPGTEPTFYYNAYYDDHSYGYTVDGLGHTGAIASTALTFHNPGQRDFYLSDTTTYRNQETGTVSIIIKQQFAGRWTYLRDYTLNKSKYLIVRRSIHPADALSKGMELSRDGKTNFGAVLNKNGVGNQYQVDNGIKELVKLPQNLLNHISREYRVIDDNAQKVEGMLRPAKRAMSMYKRRVCQGDVSVDFMDDTIYGRICLPEGDLSPYVDQVAQFQKEQEVRWVKAENQLMEQQNLASQQRQATETRAAQSRAETAEAVAEFGNSMQQFNQNATKFTQSFMNQPAPTVNFGGSDKITTNCVSVSNVINCRSR